MTQILMVCTANICRSPMAQMVGAHLANQAGLAGRVTFESAGTRAGRFSEPPDPRTKAALLKRDYPVGRKRSRRVKPDDFTRFDLILAMDQSNLDDLHKVCPDEHRGKLHLFLTFAPQLALREVPDPYFGGPQGFDRVLELCEAAAAGLVLHLRQGGVLPVQTL
ncbi:MAG: low molecular weight phosphotyrosine protein phosphatase [Rhodoferax sp.]|nr:low molecular weight phosphotyrosine protein phosphatase [Rhodoferax sp.]